MADTHIAADVKRMSRQVNMAAHLESVGRELTQRSRNPENVFILGDLSLDDGQPGDYQSILKLLEPVRGAGMSLQLTLGNHDQRENFQAVLPPGRKRLVEGRDVSVIRSRRADWYLLDSLEKTLQTPGLLGPQQLAWLTRELDANDDKPAIILVHHNPNAPGVTPGLKDTNDLLALIRPRRQVKAMIFGHTHEWRMLQDESGIHLINLPPVSYVFKSGMPSGWVDARLERSEMELQLNCLDSKDARHGQKHQLKWRK
jgi:3',5'-cyclic AMP phosphodiesterase CpdA